MDLATLFQNHRNMAKNIVYIYFSVSGKAQSITKYLPGFDFGNNLTKILSQTPNNYFCYLTFTLHVHHSHITTKHFIN